MGELWRIIQKHLDTFGVREAEFARRIGTSPTTVNSWKNRGVRNLPEKRLLEAVSEVTGEKYKSVLGAALIDIGYAQQGDRFGGGRQSHGAWELGPALMVELQLAAEEVESHVDDATGFTEEDDIEEVVARAADLGYAARDLVSIAEKIAALGVGGETYLNLEKAKELQRRKELRERVRRAGRHAMTVTRSADAPQVAEPIVQGEQQGDYDVVGRTRDPRVEPDIPEDPDWPTDPEGPEGGA